MGYIFSHFKRPIVIVVAGFSQTTRPALVTQTSIDYGGESISYFVANIILYIPV
jgi:hypothetical protein